MFLLLSYLLSIYCVLCIELSCIPEEALEFFISVDGTSEDDRIQRVMYEVSHLIESIFDTYNDYGFDSRWSVMRADDHNLEKSCHRRIRIHGYPAVITSNLRSMNSQKEVSENFSSGYFQELIFMTIYHWKSSDRHLRRIFSIWTYTKPLFGAGYYPISKNSSLTICDFCPSNLPTENQVIKSLNDYHVGLMILLINKDKSELEKTFSDWNSWITSHDISDSLITRIESPKDAKNLFIKTFSTMICPSWISTTTTHTPLSYSKQETMECMKQIPNHTHDISQQLKDCLKQKS